MVNGIVERFKSTFPKLLIIIFISLVLLTPMFIYGVPGLSGDLIHHVHLSIAYFDAFNKWELLPGWTPNENFGYGAVTVRFYPPLLHWTIAFFRFLSGNWAVAFIAAFYFWTVIGGIGIYRFANDIFKNHVQATAASFIFILAPYHVNQLYNSVAFAEYVALSILPFCFLYTRRICLESRLVDVLGLAISLALLILSNLPQVVIAACALSLFIFFYLKKERIMQAFSGLTSAGLLALLATCFFWVRLVSEMQWLNIYQSNTIPAYDYRNNFLFNSFELDARGVWAVSLYFLIMLGLLVIAALVSGKYKWRLISPDIKRISVLFIASSVMALPLSSYIWAYLPFLQRIQFPWRFLSIATIAVSLMAAHCFSFLTADNFKTKRPLMLILLGATFIYGFISIRQIALGPAFLTSMEFAQLVERERSSESLNDWLPVWAKPGIFENKNQVEVVNRTVEIEVWEDKIRQFVVLEGSSAGEAKVACLYYPFWRATVNEIIVPVGHDERGAITISIPAQRSTIRIWFEEPYYVSLTEYISIIAWLILIIIAIHWFYIKKLDKN